MLSCIMYSANSDEFFPQSSWNMAVREWAANATGASQNPMVLGPGAGGTVNNYNALFPQQVAAFKAGLLGTYLQNPQILLCPADVPNPDYYLRQQYLSSYVMNGAVNKFANGPTAKFSDPNVTGTRIVIWENDETKVPTPQNGNAYGGQWNDFSNFPDEGISRRHGQGAMVATADGGAVRMDIQDFYILAGTYPTGNEGGGPPPGTGAGTSKGNVSNGNNAAPPNDLWWWP